MKRDEVKKYLNERVKVILKGSSGNIYQGKIIEVQEGSFIILDKYKKDVTIDYEMCGLITPLLE